MSFLPVLDPIQNTTMHLKSSHLDHYIGVYCYEYLPENLSANWISVNQIVHIINYKDNIYVVLYNYRVF